MARAKSKKPATAGKRVGTKKSDMRWLAPDGSEWDSRLEYEVYEQATREGIPVRRCISGKADSPESDTIGYWHSSRSAKCRDCESTNVGTTRTYTPDLFYDPALASSARRDKGNPPLESGRYYCDVKGYLRAPKRALLRSLCKERPDLDLRFLLQRDFRISARSTIASWITRYLKRSYCVWTGRWPAEAEWIKPHAK